MAKKGSGTSATSKGERISSMSTPETNAGQTMINKLDAFRRGRKTMVTIANPNKNETNKRFIRVNGADWFRKEFNPNEKQG